MPQVSKYVALMILLAGAAVAIGAYNPFGAEVNLHPNPWVVSAGSAVAIFGAYLVRYKVQPQEPAARIAGVCVMITMVLLAGMSFVF